MAKKKYALSDRLTEEVKMIKQNLRYEHSVEGGAMSILEIIKKRVSPDLFETLNDLLLGFNDDMQLEMADNLLNFTHGHVIHTTGCPSADYVLDICYASIAAEHGILNGDAIQNMFNQK